MVKKENEQSIEQSAMELANSAQLAQVEKPDYHAMPQSKEQLEIVTELLDLERAVESGFDKATKPSDLAAAGVVFDIIDAWKTTFTEGDEVRPKVCFLIVEQDTGIQHTVMQSFDAAGIREKYAELFSKFKALAGVDHPPLLGYRFVQAESGGKAGNKPVILEKARVALNRGA